MMKQNVLIISSSPRKGGNSDLLCDRFAEGAQSAGHQAEKIFLSDWKINFCTGCGVCNRTHRCPQKDDMPQLLDKLAAADVIVLATPVYFYSMCAQLKVMIDRICPRYTELRNKKMVLIATAADTNRHALDGTIAGFQGLLDCLEGSETSGILYGLGVWELGDVRDTPLMEEAFLMGQCI